MSARGVGYGSRAGSRDMPRGPLKALEGSGQALTVQ